MANLSSTDATGASSNNVNEVHIPCHDPDLDDNCQPYGTTYSHDVLMANVISNPETTAEPSLADYIKTIEDLQRIIASQEAELAQCKIEMQSLECNKIKYDSDRVIIERNRQNAELCKENESLRSTVSSHLASIARLTAENAKVTCEKKAREEKDLEEIVCLQRANKVMSNLLKTYQQPTHTIPMLSKRPNLATNDLHKTTLGSKNPKHSHIARDSHPALYVANVLLTPSDEKASIWETKESKALAAEGRAKMLEKPGTVKPVDYY
ncbi:hypothetical protein Tco_0124771, partial [Tanacetum coccineum]